MSNDRTLFEPDRVPESIFRPRATRSNFPFAISGLLLDAKSPVPIYEQICNALRSAIALGDLPAGTVLPTSRELAAALGLGRNTVVTAYARLGAEGYLNANTRRGTRVAEQPVTAALCEPGFETGARNDGRISSGLIDISYRARRILESATAMPRASKPFALNSPDPSLYPRNALSRLLTDEFCRPPGREAHNGRQRFQSALAPYLRRMRGVDCEAGQIIPVNGIESALDLTARVMIDPGHSVLVEDPAPPSVRHAFLAAGASLEALPSDGNGADPDRASGPPPRLIYVSPSIGFPLGRQMSEPRRLAMLDLARRTRAAVLEDDTYWELSYVGSKPRALQGHDRDRQVLYFGSLNETLGPQIRAGYIVVPPALVEPFVEMAQCGGHGPDGFVLGAIATFVEDSHYAMCIKTMRAAYSQRLKLASQAMRAHVGDCRIVEPSGGYHITLLFPHGLDENAACRLAAAQGLAISPLSSFYQAPNQIAGLVLGLGTVPDRNIDAMVRQLAAVIAQARSGTRALEIAS